MPNMACLVYQYPARREINGIKKACKRLYKAFSFVDGVDMTREVRLCAEDCKIIGIKSGASYFLMTIVRLCAVIVEMVGSAGKVCSMD